MDIVDMVNSVDSKENRRFSKKEVEIIKELHDSGHSSGEISATLWAEYGVFRRRSTISQLIKRIYGGLT
jgi:hypothetical protein